jgi:D-alanine-D-alanine ligase-like ATP-grasp enzyme
MVLDLALHSSRWSPSAPVSLVTVDFADSEDSARDTDLIVRSDGTIHAVTGTRADTTLPPGLTELTIPFDDGSTRTVLVLTDLDGAQSDTASADPRGWIDRIEHARSSDDDALIIVLHPFPRGTGAVQGKSPQRRLDTFEHHAVRAGGDLLLSTHATDSAQVDIVRERVSVTGSTVSIDLSPTGSRIHIRVPGGQADAEQLAMTMLRRTAAPHALLHAMDLAADGSFVIDLDRHHRPPVLTVNQGIGTAVTVWEDEPVDLPFDRSIPARMYMWERELKRRGATVQTIGTRVLFGHGPTGRNYLVHVTETNRTGIPGSTATGNKKTARHLLQRAGVRIAEGAYFSRSTPVEDALPLLDAHEALVIKPVDGYAGRGVTVGVTTPEEFRAAWQVAAEETRTGIVVEEQFVGEDVRISVVDGVARAANKRVPPQIIGDGVSTVRDLIIAKNRDRYDNLHLHAKPIVLTAHRLARLAAAGLTPFSVLPAGETHVIDHKANLATGGEPADVTDEIHPSYLRIAERAATAFPAVSLAGVDLLAADPTQPADDDSHIIVEVNSYPDIASHGTAFSGTPRNVVAHAADLVLSAPPAWEHVRRQSVPAPVPEPTSAALLAAEMSARGFSIDWLSPRLFIAEGHGAALGFCEAMTDQTSHAARMVLRRPLLRRRILDEAGLPQPKAQVFGPRSSGRAWAYAKRLGDATVQFGGNPPIDMHGMDRRTFDALWADNASTIRSHNAAIAARATGTRFDVLVVNGRVLSSVRISRAGDVAGRVDLRHVLSPERTSSACP